MIRYDIKRVSLSLSTRVLTADKEKVVAVQSVRSLPIFSCRPFQFILEKQTYSIQYNNTYRPPFAGPIASSVKANAAPHCPQDA